MDYTPFRMAPVDDRREELASGVDPIGTLISALQSQFNFDSNPMMSSVAGVEPVLTKLGQQAGMLDVIPSHQAWRMQRAKQEMAALMNARAAGAKGFDEVIDPNGPPVKLDRRLNRGM